MYYRCRAAEFLIRDNISRHDINGRIIVFRIVFENIWQWHIAEEIGEIITVITQQCFTDKKFHWDCLWMLKSGNQKRNELFYCDIIFFGDDDIPDDLLNKVLYHLNYERECVDKAVLLIQNGSIVPEFKELQKLCFPPADCRILQCEFAHNITG